MRCALVIPSWVPEDIFSSKTASSQINYWQPLGTLYVAAVLQRAGHEVIFLNGAFMSHEQILADIKKFNPAFIGLYSTTFGWKKAKKTAEDIRRMFAAKKFISNNTSPSPLSSPSRGEDGSKSAPLLRGENGSKSAPPLRGEDGSKSAPLLRGEDGSKSAPLLRGEDGSKSAPHLRGEDGAKSAPPLRGGDEGEGDVFICAGGPYPIAVQEKCLEDAGEIIDAVVTGEGEFTSLEIIERLQKGKGLDGVLGVIYWDKGNIRKNPLRPLITDLDSLPLPARELLGDANLYIPPPATYRRKPVAVLMTSRGCNRRCIYCFQIDKDRKSGVRFRSVENVMKEIEYCIAQGYREIKFIDDTLAADYNRAMQIAQEIKSRKLDFTWFASACVNQVDKPLLQAFKDAGCWAVLFGAESGVQKNLNAIKKGSTLAQIRNAVKTAKEVGIKVSTPFMFGIPGETYEEGLQTIQFALDLDPDIANFHAITPFPGSYLYDNLDKYGTISDELTDFTYQGAAFIPYTMTRDEILKLRQLAFRKFYARPSFILKKLLELRTINDFKVAFKSLNSLFWIIAKSDLFKRRLSNGKRT